ncbi:hypothetical protein JYT84_00095 [bacterium AH-315-M10]|nr:hypothetical protein [bacterium AH-315-M10]
MIDNSLLRLAAHYRLIDPSLLDERETEEDCRVLLGDLRETGWIDDTMFAFLQQKADWLEKPSISSQRFLELAVSAGYLTDRDVEELLGSATHPGAKGDYEAAVWCYALGLLELWQIIDLFELCERALLRCSVCEMGLYPEAPEDLDQAPVCPDCGQALQLLTFLPRFDRGAEPLPVLSQLRIQPLGLRGEAGPAAHVLRIARHYRLITDAQTQLVAIGEDDIAAMARLLLEEGLLTTTEFRFLVRRSKQTLAEGMGSLGQPDPKLDLLEQASSLGYVSTAVRERLGEHPLFVHHAENLPGRQEFEVAAIQMLYNLGSIRFYMAIDLLELRGLPLDHCVACKAQWMELDAPCPGCGGTLVRLTGWDTPETLARPLPLPPRLIIHRPVTAELLIDGEGAVSGYESSPVLPVLAQRQPEQVKGSDDKLVGQLVNRYHLLDSEQLEQAEALAETSDGTLLGVLSSIGFLPPSAVGFLRRKIGLAPVVENRDMLAVAIRHGYLSPRILPEGAGDEPIPDQIALHLLEVAFNRGQLKLYQLVDALESAGVRLEHCSECQVQLLCDEAEIFVRDCPACDQQLQPLYRPGETLPAALPRLTELNVYTYMGFQSGSPSLEASHGELSTAGLEADDGAALADADLLVDRLIRRYQMMSGDVLSVVREKYQSHGREQVLEEALFQDGFLHADALGFLSQMREQLMQGDSVLGTQSGRPLTEIAQAKGYLSLLRFHKLFRQPGAPDPGGDEMEIAAFLHDRGAMRLFQLVHVLEEKGLALLHCTPCGLQFHVTGRVDATQAYLCSRCMEPMTPLTALPGVGHQFDVLPEIPSLRIEQVRVNELQTLRSGSRRIRQLVESHVPSLQAPPLMQIALDDVPGDSWASRAARSKRVLELHKKRRESLDSFYQREFPAASPEEPRCKSSGKFAVAQQAPPSGRRTMRLDQSGRPQGAGSPEDLLQQGIAQIRRAGLMVLFLLATGLGLGLYSGRSEIKPPPQPSAREPELQKTRRTTLFGQVDPTTIDLAADPPQFQLQVDLDLHYWVLCDSREAKTQLGRLVTYLKTLSKGEPVRLKVDGTIEQNEEGADATQSGGNAYHISAVKLQRVFKLPKVRIRQD